MMTVRVRPVSRSVAVTVAVLRFSSRVQSNTARSRIRSLTIAESRGASMSWYQVDQVRSDLSSTVTPRPPIR